MKSDNAIQRGLDAALKPSHFQRRLSVWYRDLDEAILVVEAQKSNFGKQYYLNLAVLVKRLVPGRKLVLPPKEHQCDVRIRVEALRPDLEDKVRTLLDLENEIVAEPEREREIEAIVREVVIPFLDQCSTLEGIQAARRAGRLDAAVLDGALDDLEADR